MAIDRTSLRATAAFERRPPVSSRVPRRPAEIQRSPTVTLQQRIGNRATQIMIARSIASQSKETEEKKKQQQQQQAKVNVASPKSVQHSKWLRLPGKVSKAYDPAELEAEETARKVIRMQTPHATKPAAPKGTVTGSVQRAEATHSQPAPAAPPRTVSSSRVNISGGSPLPGSVRSHMEPRFGASFANVRIHTGDAAAHQTANVNAHAFTVGDHIFFGRDQYQPHSASGKELIAHELTHTIQQQAVVQRSVDTTVTQRSEPRIQRLGISDALDWIADKANYLPGFRLLTIVLGMNPINMAPVDRSAANVLRALLEMIPVTGALIAEALERYGIFAKVGGWIEGQIRTLGLVGSQLKGALTKFLDSLSWTDIFDLDDVYERGKRIFTEPITKLIDFGKSLVVEILTFIRQAILIPLAKLAENTKGYDLLKAVLGQDPVTGEPVPRTPEILIGGFMKFIGQEEIWENMKKANAIPRAWAWFQGALQGLMGFVRQIPTLFINALKSLEIIDLVLPPKAFIKVASAFGGFALQFVTWAGNTIWTLLEIIFDVVSPGALTYIKKTGAALKSILKNPLPFVLNLVRAAKLGFQQFADNIGSHLKAGLIDWLTGSLEGVYIPKALSLPELGKFALSVLGISWARIRAKIVKALGPNGETIMKVLETGFDIVVALVTGGPAAAWELIKEKLTELKDQVISGIIGFVTDAIVKKAIPKLIAMFIPGAGFISAIISIYDTIMVFVEKISKIIQVVKAFIDSIVAIAGGNITAAANRVESILSKLLSLAISFLAGFLGLGKITDKIKEIIEKVRLKVDQAIDAVIKWIVDKAKALFAKLFGKDKDKDDKRDFRVKAKEELAKKFQGKLTKTQMQDAVADVYSKYQKEGLKGIVAKHPSGKTSQYEAVLIASSIPVSTAEASFEIDAADLDLGWGRTSATGVVIAGSKKQVFGPYQNDGENHAEENLMAVLNKNFDSLLDKKANNTLIFNITRSPCGDMPKAHNCAKQIRQFVAKWKGKYSLDVEVRAASIYFGKFRKASREAIKKIVDSGIKFTAWDLVEELGDPSEVSKETIDKLQKRIDSTKENLPDIIKVGAGE